MKRTTRNNKVRSRVGKSFLPRYVRLLLWLLDIHNLTKHYLVMGQRVAALLAKNGNEFSVLYLKECVRLIHHWIADRPEISREVGVRVATRRGLPTIIPGILRLRMEAKELVVIRAVLTILSVFRIIKYPGTLKLETITNPFTGASKTLPAIEIALTWKRFFPFIPNIPIRSLGLDRPLLLKSAGPNYRVSILGAPLDALAWAGASMELRNAFKVLSDHWCPELWKFLELEMSAVSGYTPKNVTKLGKLSKKLEAAGKIRIFAIADVWTQTLLKPLHEYIFMILKCIPQDGTFDQSAPLILLATKLRERDPSNRWVASYDLSAATDRLPIDVQVQVLSLLAGNREVAEAWASVLVGRDWWFAGKAYRYSVGQPMGALSSWGMLALTHHMILQMAAIRVGKTAWFEDYAILGDDIVIADKAVAEAYHFLMTEILGVDINLSKSIVSDSGVMEFAKRIVGPFGEVSPIGPKNLSGCLTNPASLPSLLLDYLGKGGNLTSDWVETKFSTLCTSKDIVRLSKGGVDAIVWTVLKPFGFIQFPGLTGTKVLVDSRGLEYDPWIVLEAIDLALNDKIAKEQDQALEKTMKSVNALRATLHSWREAKVKLGGNVPPSYQWLIHDSDMRLKEIAAEIGAGSAPIYVDPSGKTLSEIMQLKLDAAKSVSPLDNCLVRARVVKPRIRRLNLDFFKRVRRYVQALAMM